MSEQRRSVFEAYDDCRQRTGKSPIMQAVAYSRAVADKADPFRLTHVISTPGVKRDGYDVVQTGWITDDWALSGSPVYWRHAQNVPEDLMGNGRVWKSKAPLPREIGLPNGTPHLRGETTFLPDGMNGVSDMVRDYYFGGHMTATSVRWEDNGEGSVVRIAPADIPDMPGMDPWVREYGGARFLEARMIEYSLVPQGLDKAAVTLRMRTMPPELQEKMVANKEGAPPEGRELIHLDGRAILVEGKVFSFGKRDGEEVADPSAQPAAEDAPATEEVPAETPVVDSPADAPSTPPADPVTEEAPAAPAPAAAEAPRAAIPYSIHANLPIAPRETPWNATAAKKRLVAWASNEKGQIDHERLRKAALRYNPAKPDNVAAMVGFHHDVIDGRLSLVPRGVYAAAQRLQQGAFDGSADDLVLMREHLTKEYGRLSEELPWDTRVGQNYEQLHAMLAGSAGDAVTALRAAVVNLAVEVYGAERVLEAWEDAPLPAGDADVWRAVRESIGESLSGYVSDPEDREALTDDLMRRVSEPISPIMDLHVRGEQFRTRLADTVGIDEDESDWENTVILRVGEFSGEVRQVQRTVARAELDTKLEGLRSKAAALGALPSKGAGTPPMSETLLDRIANLGRRVRGSDTQDSQ